VSGTGPGGGGGGGEGAVTGGHGGNGGSGAGIANAADPGSVSSFLSNDTLSGNSTGAGGTGGLNPFGVGGNGGNSGGGAGLDNAGLIGLSNDTVAGNSAGPGGNGGSGGGKGSSGAGYGILASGATTDLAATIVAESTGGNDCAGSVGDNGFNIADDASCAFTQASSTNHSLTLDGSLGPLKNNGGPTQTIALTGGPAVDVVAAPDCPATDQRGAPRTAPCDIGAYDSDTPPFIRAIDINVSGSQTLDSNLPTFTESDDAPGGVSMTGTLTCTSVDGGTAINASLALGSYTVDGSSCSGLTTTDPTDYPVFPSSYSGVMDGFVVSRDTTKLSLTASPSPVTYGNETTTVFTVTLLTGNGEELSGPEGVTVDVGTTSCPVTLKPTALGGSGTCSIGNSALIGGSYSASVNYPGDTDLQGSGPADAAFVVSLALTAPPLPNPVFNAAYTTTISTGVSGTAPVSFSETGALPAGVTLLTTGAFSGTPTNAAQIGKSFPITVHATDANGATGSQAYTLTLGSPCGAGLTTDVLTATSASGNFMGIFCVNAAGTGTYTQGTVHGTGTVSTSSGATRITAFGTNLALIGQAAGTTSRFTETAPAPAKAGTFTLS
jgi:hypothetical protein